MKGGILEKKLTKFWLNINQNQKGESDYFRLSFIAPDRSLRRRARGA